MSYPEFDKVIQLESDNGHAKLQKGTDEMAEHHQTVSNLGKVSSVWIAYLLKQFVCLLCVWFELAKDLWGQKMFWSYTVS